MRRADVLAGYAAQGRIAFDALAAMAAEIQEGKLDDSEDELLGILLKSLYPKVLSPTEALRHLRMPKLVEMIGELGILGGPRPEGIDDLSL